MVHLYGATHGTIRNNVTAVFVMLGIYGYEKEVTWQMCDDIAYPVEAAVKDVFPRAYDAWNG